MTNGCSIRANRAPLHQPQPAIHKPHHLPASLYTVTMAISYLLFSLNITFSREDDGDKTNISWLLLYLLLASMHSTLPGPAGSRRHQFSLGIHG